MLQHASYAASDWYVRNENEKDEKESVSLQMANAKVTE